MRTILTLLYDSSCISRLRRTPLWVMALGARAAVDPTVIAVDVLCVHVLFGCATFDIAVNRGGRSVCRLSLCFRFCVGNARLVLSGTHRRVQYGQFRIQRGLLNRFKRTKQKSKCVRDDVDAPERRKQSIFKKQWLEQVVVVMAEL